MLKSNLKSNLKSKILFILTGSIACYKACQIVSRLVQSGHEVQIIATPSALRFIGSATLEGLTGRKIFSDMYEEGQMMNHIHWARWADLILVAPATANFINKISNGLADDLASTLFLSYNFKIPFLIAPAMNSSMYSHPITQKSLRHLESLGIQILETASGILACGEEGFGKLLDPDLILQEISQYLPEPPKPPTSTQDPNDLRFQSLIPQSKIAKDSSQRILITAGGTSERIDDVRVITNRSTGSTGFYLSQEFWEAGLPVTLLLSETSCLNTANHEFEVLKFSDFESLRRLLFSELSNKNYTHVFHLAAVSDYSVESLELDGIPLAAPDTHWPSDKPPTENPLPSGKIASGKRMSILMKSNPKIVNDIKDISLNKSIKLVSFKLTSGADNKAKVEAVERLMTNSNSDYVVHNDWQQIHRSPLNHAFSIFKTNSKDKAIHQPLAAVPIAESIDRAGLGEYFIQEIL